MKIQGAQHVSLVQNLISEITCHKQPQQADPEGGHLKESIIVTLAK